MNILIVQQNADARAELKSQLSGSGFSISEADSAEAAEEAMKTGKYELVIADLSLENSDSGFTLGYHLKRDYPSVPFILLSSTVNLYDIAFSRESGWERNWIAADVLLNKPVRFEQLLSSVQKVLHITPQNAH
ncbi:MAG: response regulator [Planctomycetaceae bacterium]|nr:response regulator [Planctomycetaceae bacterium]